MIQSAIQARFCRCRKLIPYKASIWFALKMADFLIAIQMVNDLVTRLDRLNVEDDRFDVGTLVLRLDVLHRMLVNLDIDQGIAV